MNFDQNAKIHASPLTVLHGHKNIVQVCRWNPMKDLLATGSSDHTARIWNMSDDLMMSNPSVFPSLVLPNLIENTKGFFHPVTSLEWNWDGSMLAMGGSVDGYTLIYNSDGKLCNTLVEEEELNFESKWNKKGNYLLTVCDNGTTIVRDSLSGECVRRFALYSNSISDVDWKSCDTFATSSRFGGIFVCNTNAEKPIKSFDRNKSKAYAVKWDPQGKLLASCCTDMTLKIWSMEQDDCVHNLGSFSKDGCAIEWSPTGPGTENPNMNLILASIPSETTIRLWDIERGKCIHELTEDHASFSSVAFSPDGRFIASDSIKGIQIWSTANGQLVHSYKAGRIRTGVCWNSRSTKICGGTMDGPVFVLDIRKF